MKRHPLLPYRPPSPSIHRILAEGLPPLLLPLLILLTACYNPLPADLLVAGVTDPVINLNGRWEIDLHPRNEFWVPGDTGNWRPIEVPGEPMMQGFAIRHDEPFAYRRTLQVPADYEGKTILLQFDGVYNHARVWMNGHYIRDHHGGFTRWACDITPHVTPGSSALLVVEVTDRADGIAYGSGYAKHMIGGILRDVTLRAVPSTFPEDIVIITDFDSIYKNAVLSISATFKNTPDNGMVTLQLTDPFHTSIPLQHDELMISDTGTVTISNTMRSPRKWDAEHPELYALTLSYLEDGRLLYRNKYHIGFREVEVQGNRLLVNGREVKLRGANRHDIHPLLGRVSTPEYERRDVRLAREANMNFIRTSHYPPTENFLALCDKYGLYVEDETAVCFVGSHRTKAYYPGASENDTAFTDRYMMQLKEMVAHHRNHPSVILWSVGNENSFGSNFKRSYDWIKAADPTRPVLFSYPGNVPDSVRAYDILSMHYPGMSGSMTQLGKTTRDWGYGPMPVIFDEWAHVACYNNFTLMEDPNIRDFWGRSLDSMWTRVYAADGGLGGAIWGMIDETFMLPDTLPGFTDWWGIVDAHVIPATYAGHTVGYGEWGIVDTWRRKKPEFWNTRKAYSPFKILKTRYDSVPEYGLLEVPVHNRFDHTNLNELRIRYVCNGTSNLARNIDLEPGQKGILSLHVQDWDPVEPIYLEARDARGQLIDQYHLHLVQEDKDHRPAPPTGRVQFIEDDSLLTVECSNQYRMVFDRSTGLLQSISKGWDSFPLAGPFLNLRTKGPAIIYSYHRIVDHTGWNLQEFRYETTEDGAWVRLMGTCADSIPVAFEITISPDAEMKIQYIVDSIPEAYIRELGIRFILAESPDAISWKRDGYWSYYPELHLSAPAGLQTLYPEKLKKYRTIPPKDWAFDTRSFYYDGTAGEEAGHRLAYRAKATKEHIREYSLVRDGQNVLTVHADGDVHCRLAKQNDHLTLHISNAMDYVDLSWGNFQRNIWIQGQGSGSFHIKPF